MARSTAIHDRVAAAILDAAADLLARGGEPPTMSEVAAGGSKYAALISRFGVSDYGGDAEQQIGAMIRALLQRGLDDGTFRGDLTVTELLFLLGQLLQAAARMTAEHVAGVEKAAALVTSVFLHGTERRQDATAVDPAADGNGVMARKASTS